MVLPVEHTVEINDIIIIEDRGNEKRFQIKRQSVEPYFCLQELASK